MDRERRAQWRGKLRFWRKPCGLTLGALAVGEALLRLLGPDGRCDPSVATLAKLARVCERTVHDSLARLSAAGFVTWVRRIVRSSATGWQAQQTSNAYALAVPAGNGSFPHDCRMRRGVTRESSLRGAAPPAAPDEAAIKAAQEALERRQRRFEAAWLAAPPGQRGKAAAI
jgi:hypothetical protein